MSITKTKFLSYKYLKQLLKKGIRFLRKRITRDGAELLFHIDGITQIENTTNQVIIHGWAVDNALQDTVKNVYLIIDDKIHETEYGLNRNDVAEAYNNPAYRYSGFRLVTSMVVGSHIIKPMIEDKRGKKKIKKVQTIKFIFNPTLPRKNTMYCISNHAMFIKANGNLVCWCDAGVNKTLQNYDKRINYGEDVYLGPVYNFIRDKLYNNEMPFPEYCQKCLLLEMNTSMSFYALENKVLDVFQIEPSVLCNLQCTSCVTQKFRKSLPKPHILPLNIFSKIVNDLRKSNIKVNRFDFSGHGEPLLNKDIWHMVRLVKDLFPESRVTICTNANSKFREDYVSSGVDEIIFAIDGADQDSYAQYRINGKFDMAYNFMKYFSLVSKERNLKINIIWKYVLFSHNDSNEQLIKAQYLAKDAFVDELRFMNTQLTSDYSRIVEISQIPIVENNLNINLHYYGPSIDKLNSEISLANKYIEQKNIASAKEVVQTVTENLLRFFGDYENVSSLYKKILSDLCVVIRKFPKDDRDYFETKISRLVK